MRTVTEFEQLLKAANRTVRGVVMRFLRGYESYTDDVLQDASFAAWRHFEDFEERSTFKTWYTRIAINHALMWMRARKALESKLIFESSMHHTENEDGQEVDIWTRTPASTLNPEQLAIRKQQRNFLIQEINWLPTTQRKAILRYLWEPTIESTEKSARFRARHMLLEGLCVAQDVEKKSIMLRDQTTPQHGCLAASRM